MKLLVVEDEPRMARMLQQGLSEEGHQVDVCGRADEALAQAEAIAYDVVLLDWGLPDQDGVSLLRNWRSRGLRTPVLLVTARGSTGEKVVGLRAGADDYLVKPFDFDELLARTEALHRRGGNGPQPMRRAGELELDAMRRVLRRGQAEVPLTGREFGLIEAFFSRAGDVLTRPELLSAAWGEGFDGNPNIVDVYVGYLRQKLERVAGGAASLESIRGVGYRLRLEGGQAT
jgi:DNA-binding response OmpR family regulator